MLREILQVLRPAAPPAHGSSPDDEGLEFPGIDAAEHEAAETAAAIGRDLLPKDVAHSVTVEVRSQHGQRVATATVTLAVDRVDPEPIPAPGDNARRR